MSVFVTPTLTSVIHIDGTGSGYSLKCVEAPGRVFFSVFHPFFVHANVPPLCQTKECRAGINHLFNVQTQ